MPDNGSRAPYPIGVLIVDDEDVRGMLFQRVVEEQDDMLHLATIPNENQLIDYLSEMRPDVMIISVLMGHQRQNCIRLTKHAMMTYADLPVIWYGGPADWMPLAQAMGVFAFMPKPVNLKDLVELIRGAHELHNG